VTHLDERYPDLLGMPDHDLERVVADLDRVGHLSRAAHVPPHADAALVRALSERAATPRQVLVAPHRPRLVTPKRGPMLLLAAALVGLVIVGGSAAYAGVPLIDQALSWFDTTAQQSTGHKLGQEVNLAQSACGYTMTIKRVYADANQVVVGYTLNGPADRTFIGGFDVRPTLSDAHGRAVPWMSGSGTGATPSNETGNVVTFDASAVVDAPSTLTLHLVAPTILTTERLGDTPAAASPCETYRPFKKDEAPASWDIAKTRWVTVAVPFTFDVTVPFIAGHAADVHQMVEVGGTAVTLERVVVTPIETRLYVRGVTPGTGFVVPQANAQLSVGDQTINSAVSILPTHGLAVYSFSTSLYHTRGEATVVVNPRPDFAQPGQPTISGGPWTFHFTLPS